MHSNYRNYCLESAGIHYGRCGAITPNDVDTVIASILITSLYFNYLLLVDFDNKRPKGGV